MLLFVQPRLGLLHESVRGAGSAVLMAGIAITLQAGPLVEPLAWANTAALYLLVAALGVLGVQVWMSLRALLRRGAMPIMSRPPAP
jgi:hypothetical protein